MSASYAVGKFVAKHKVLTAIVALGVLVFAVRGCSRSEVDPREAAAVASGQAQAARAASDAIALKERCSTGYPALLVEAKAARDKGDAGAALELLYPCRESVAGIENKALLAQVAALSEAARKKKVAAENAELAKAEQAEKARKKKEGVHVGMTKQDVLDSSWGRPDHVNTTTTAAGSREQWVYGLRNYLYFVDGTLTAIQN